MTMSVSMPLSHRPESALASLALASRKLVSPVMSAGSWLCGFFQRHVAILIRHERRDVDEDFDVASM